MGLDGSGQRTTAFFAGAIAIALVLAGCPTPGGDGEAAAFKLGSILPLTGDLQAFGPSAEKAVRLAVQQVNNNGGVNGKDVIHISEDSETSQQAAPQAVSRLLNVEGIHGLVGAMGSGVSLSFIDQVVQAGVPMISPSNTAPTFTTQYCRDCTPGDKGWYFRTVPADTLQGKVMNQLVQQNYSRAAILAINNDYGVGFGNVFQSEYETTAPSPAGRDITDFVKYSPQATTFGSTVDDVVGANEPQENPQAIVVIGYPDTVSAIMTTAFEKGYAGPNGSVDWFFSEGLKDESGFVDQVNTTQGGEYILAGYKGTTPQFEVGQEFASAFKAEYGSSPALFSDTTFDAAMLQMLAAEQCDCVQRQPLQDALYKVQNNGTEVSDAGEALQMIRNGEDIDWDGAAGEMTWNKIGDVTTGTYAVWQVTEEGKIVTIQSDIQVS